MMAGDVPPKAELEILAILTRSDRLSAKEIREQLSPSRKLTNSAVSTLLSRLMSRGLVQRKKANTDKTYLYRSAPKGVRIQRSVVRHLAKRLFGGDPTAMVASLFEHRIPTPKELVQLQALLDELKEQQVRSSEDE